MNYAIKVNVAKIPNAFKATIKGTTKSVECICIPVENLYQGEKGVYLNLYATELREPKYKETHFVKVSVDDDVYKAMTKEQQDAIPIIGGITPILKKEVVHEPAPQMQVENSADLPF